MEDEEYTEDEDYAVEPYAWSWQVVPVVALEFGRNVSLSFATAFDGLLSGAKASLLRRLNFSDALDEIESLPVAVEHNNN